MTYQIHIPTDMKPMPSPEEMYAIRKLKRLIFIDKVGKPLEIFKEK